VDFSTKASVLRGRVRALETLGYLQRVLDALPDSARRAALDPPPISSWVDGATVVAIDEAISTLLGEATLHEVALRTQREAVSPLLRGVTESVLQLFGASPATLLARLDMLSRSTVKGLHFEWESTGARSDVVTASYPTSADIPRSTFVSIRAGLLNVFDLTGARGDVTLRPLPATKPRNSGQYDCRW
jgi:hypothetical protein